MIFRKMTLAVTSATRDDKNTSTYEKIIRVSRARMTSATPEDDAGRSVMQIAARGRSLSRDLHDNLHATADHGPACAAGGSNFPANEESQSRFPLTDDTRARLRRAAPAGGRFARGRRAVKLFENLTREYLERSQAAKSIGRQST